jgi:hypothetical protein
MNSVSKKTGQTGQTGQIAAHYLKIYRDELREVDGLSRVPDYTRGWLKSPVKRLKQTEFPNFSELNAAVVNNPEEFKQEIQNLNRSALPPVEVVDLTFSDDESVFDLTNSQSDYKI